MKLLLIEDDRKLSASIAKNLRAEAFIVDQAFDGCEGEELARINNYDSVILDVRLPSQDGIETCRRLREQGFHVPIIMLTALDDVSDKVRGLDSGADDYLTKPFSISELTARIRALSRRPLAMKSCIVKQHGVVLDPATHLVSRDGKTVNLSPREFALLELLMSKNGRIVKRDDIMEKLWDMNANPGSNVIDAQVKLLRRKIDREFDIQLINTIRGVGYCFGPCESNL